MRWFVLLVLVLSAETALARTPARARDAVAVVPVVTVPGSFTVLSYHEVRREVRDFPDPFAVDATYLVRQFAWLRGNGYTPVSLDDIVAARAGGKPLPAKAVLLSFDDAYLSFYTRVYPLLREFNFPAVLGVVGKWIDSPRTVPALYGEPGTVAADTFTNWDQLREMAASGLVEIASHTYDLHRGVPANPQGNLQPAATARVYAAATASYEGDESWRSRVSLDLAANSAAIERETGRRPRAVVWPYGSYNDELVRMAGEWGMTIGLTLDDGTNSPDVPLTGLRRVLMEHNPALPEFTIEERGPLFVEPKRVVQVDLDAVYSADAAQQERNLSALLDRINVLKPTHVYLRATADTDGDGIPDATYFPTRHLPLRADLFNRAAWQLISRDDVKVYAVLPLAGLRLSPDAVADVYEDLARYASFDGLVFDDKAPANDIAAAGSVEFTHRLAARARAFRAPLKTARVLYAAAATIEEVSGLFAQNLALYVPAYDYVVLQAPPAHGTVVPDDWPSTFVARYMSLTGPAPLEPASRRKVVFMLREEAERPVDVARSGTATAMTRQMRALQLAGVLNFGYGADDFMHDIPPFARIAPAMSLRVYPLAVTPKEK